MSEHIKIFKLNSHAYLPVKSSENAVGWDIHACLHDIANENYKNLTFKKEKFEDYLNNFSITLNPGKSCIIPAGFICELPHNVEMDIKSRSGLFLKKRILVQGTVDPDYRGEVKIMLLNLSDEVFNIQHLDRIAQAVFRTVHNSESLIQEVSNFEELSSTQRSQNGFGSTGI